VQKLMGNHQGVYGCNRSVTGYMFCISQIPKKKWQCSWMVHQLFIDCNKVYDSVRTAVLYNIFIEFGIPMKLFSLIKMSSIDTLIAIQVGKCLSYIFPIKNGLKKGDTLSTLLQNMPLGFKQIRRG